MQPQPPPQQEPPEAGPEEEPPLDFVPLAGAAKTESWIVFFELSHLGQVMDCFWFKTMRS